MITEEQVRHIHRLDGHGLPIVSLYAKVPPERDQAELHTRVNSLLPEVRAMGTDHAADRPARLSVRSDVERILEYVDTWPVWPGTLAFFSCSGEGVFEVVSLPRPVRDRIVVDDTPWVRSLVAVLAEYHRVCVVLLKRGEASLWELYQDELREIRQRREPKLRHAPRPRTCGWATAGGADEAALPRGRRPP
jgi:peptide chain release factor subunit 1